MASVITVMTMGDRFRQAPVQEAVIAQQTTTLLITVDIMEGTIAAGADIIGDIAR